MRDRMHGAAPAPPDDDPARSRAVAVAPRAPVDRDPARRAVPQLGAARVDAGADPGDGCGSGGGILDG